MILPEFMPESFRILQLDHEFHEEVQDDCLWCNGFMARWWRAVNQDD